MSQSRMHNFAGNTPPPAPVPRTPILETVTPGDTTVNVVWEYPENTIEVDHWDIDVTQGSVLIGTVRVEGAGTRSHTLGELTNSIEYGIKMLAVNINGRSPYSSMLLATPKAADIPAPVIVSVTAGNGVARVVCTDKTPATVLGHKYVAKRIDSGFEFVGDLIPVDGFTTGDTAPIDNDRDYLLYLATVTAKGVSPYSAASKQFRPTEPLPPYAPIWVHVDVDKTGTKASGSTTWKMTVGKGARVHGDASPTDLTSFRYVIQEKSTMTLIAAGSKPTSFSPVDITVSNAPWCDGVALMSLWASNKDGESAPTVIEFDTDPHAELPIDFGVFEEKGLYRYHYAQDDIKALARVNKNGVGLALEVLVIGAAGNGAGRTTLGAMGGGGGSGECITTTVKPFTTGSITAKVGDGATYMGTTAGGYSYATIVDGNQIIARGGGQAVGKADGTPSYTTPAKEIDALMPGASELRLWAWNKPFSTGVGGVMEWDKNNAPNAKLYGQGGGGTNSTGANHGGDGGNGVVVIRYLISDVPTALEPVYTWRQRQRVKRFEKRHAREVRAASE